MYDFMEDYPNFLYRQYISHLRNKIFHKTKEVALQRTLDRYFEIISSDNGIYKGILGMIKIMPI
jgi:hypothetical protein